MSRVDDARHRAAFGGLVVHFLGGRPGVWVAAVSVSLVLTVVMSYFEIGMSLAIGGVLVALACAGIVVKDQTYIVGKRRVMRRSHRLSRRRVLAMAFAIAIAASVLTAFARAIGWSIIWQNQEELKRRSRPNPKKGEF
jgi:uncharacterized membrane protein